MARNPRFVPICGVFTATEILHVPVRKPTSLPFTNLHVFAEFGMTCAVIFDFSQMFKPAFTAI
jgi:hypothetical protein